MENVDSFPDMADAFEISAPAKTNLSLRVVGKREDGFHEIETRMVRLSLSDRLRLKWRDDDRVVLRCADPDLPTDESNLVVKAVRALEAHTGKKFAISIDLEKNIPVAAGLGGGSSDAAAVLRGINEMADLQLPVEELADVSATIGSDIPFFVYDSTCDCGGRGEIVKPVPEANQSLPVLLLKPGFGISAAWAYQKYGASSEYSGFLYLPQICPWGEMVNDLERPVFEKYPHLGEMKNWLLRQPAVHAALLSGSGSTMLAILRPGSPGDSLVDRAVERYGENCWTFLGRTS